MNFLHEDNPKRAKNELLAVLGYTLQQYDGIIVKLVKV